MNLILFALCTIGMSHIIVDGSIFDSFRSFFKKTMEKMNLSSFGNIVDCYLCCGTWCGFLMGYIWISNDPLKIFACGCAGGFLSNFAAVIINLFESLTLFNLNENQNE